MNYLVHCGKKTLSDKRQKQKISKAVPQAELIQPGHSISYLLLHTCGCKATSLLLHCPHTTQRHIIDGLREGIKQVGIVICSETPVLISWTQQT